MIEGTSTPISVGIFSGLIKLANSLERSVAYNAREVEALGIGRTILSVFRTNEEKNLWASLQEIHNDAAASLSPYSSLIGLMVRKKSRNIFKISYQKNQNKYINK